MRRALFFTIFLCGLTSVRAQTGSFQFDNITIAEQSLHWREDPGLFLEPNRFSVTKELQDRAMWLQVGFGRPVMAWRFNSIESNSELQFDLEALAWSRLQILSDFRFPVETIDYFFGISFIWDRNDYARAHREGISSAGESWRLRISHISSHDVDGKDTVIGGSSSHYSREFVEVMRQFLLWDRTDFLLTVGIRGYFHQVSHIEPWLAFPACLTWRIEEFGRSGSNSFSAFVSTGDGPVWPTLTAGLRLDRWIGTSSASSISGLQVYYQYGASWSGTDAGTKRSTINLQMDVRGF